LENLIALQTTLRRKIHQKGSSSSFLNGTLRHLMGPLRFFIANMECHDIKETNGKSKYKKNQHLKR
jgi:hypothetical protein